MDNKRIKAAIIGPGNIGIDLMYKIFRRSKYLDLQLLAGIYADSKGGEIAGQLGIEYSNRSIDAILEKEDIKIVFDATSAGAHYKNGPLLQKAGKIAIDLTPAALGPYVIPTINLEEHLTAPNVNMITCGGQATIPIVKAITRAVPVSYAEIVATIASKSAGPGTRQNIDEFTKTTANGIVKLGGARTGKAIIILNPAEPPIIMKDTIYAKMEEANDRVYQAVTKSVLQMVCEVQKFVPGYRLKLEPTFDGVKVTVMVQVEGAGDYLPKYSGNLDIMTCAALTVGEGIAENILKN